MKTANTPLFESFIFFCFWLSGATALTYEVLWMRYFTDLMGSTSLATSLILTSYMGGMALGAALAKRWADRLKSGVRVYGWLEIAVGIYALISPLMFKGLEALYPVLLQNLPSSLILSIAVRFALACLILLIPTVCMGATLPIMIKALTTSVQETGTKSGWLYGINTLGAVSGTLLAGFLLVPTFGVHNSVMAVALINIVLGAAVVGLSFRQTLVPASETAETETLPSRQRQATDSRRLYWPYLIITGSGAVAMSYEVAWTRLLSMTFGTSTYAFTLILATFLSGLALGSLVFGYWGDKSPRHIPALIAGLLSLAALCSLTTMGLLAQMPYLFGFVYLQAKNAGWITEASYTASLFIQSFLAILTMLPSTFFLGGLFPLIIRQTQNAHTGYLGRSSANVYVFNTVGAVSGSLLAGFAIGPLLGLYNSVYLGTAVLLSLATVALIKSHLKPAQSILASSIVWLCGAGLWLSNPNYDARQLFLEAFQSPDYVAKLIADKRFQEALMPPENILFYEDGISSTVVVGKFKKHLSMLTDGKGDASTASELIIRKALAHLPLSLTDKPQKALIIGLGGGETVSNALKHSVKSVEVVEIESAVVKACKELFTPFIGNIFADPRLNIHIDDAKSFIRKRPQHFDVIISQGSHPWRSGSSRLFTQEFWQDGQKALKPGGVFAQWVQLYQIHPQQFYSIMATFQSVYPYTHLFRFGHDGLLIGSTEPLVIDLDRYLSQINKVEILKNLDQVYERSPVRERSWRKIQPIDLLAHYELGPTEIQMLTQNSQINTIQNPTLEFTIPYSLLNTKHIEPLLSDLNNIPAPYNDYFAFDDLEPEAREAIKHKLKLSLSRYRPEKSF